MGALPILTAVTITAKDINGGDILKQFNTVYQLNFDYNRRTVNVVDATGSFYFDLADIATLTYTVGVNTTTVVMS